MEKVLTALLDGDRGGDLILKELLQVAGVDFVARAPRGREVEEMTQKQIMKALRNKIPAEQYVEMYGLGAAYKPSEKEKEVPVGPSTEPAPQRDLHEPPQPLEPMPVRAPPRAEPSRAPPKPVSTQLRRFRDALMSIGGASKLKFGLGG